MACAMTAARRLPGEALRLLLRLLLLLRRWNAHLGLLSTDAVDSEAAADIIQQAEVLARLLDRDDICEEKREEGCGGEHREAE